MPSKSVGRNYLSIHKLHLQGFIQYLMMDVISYPYYD